MVEPSRGYPVSCYNTGTGKVGKWLTKNSLLIRLPHA
jgi:hypothetical protein